MSRPAAARSAFAPRTLSRREAHRRRCARRRSRSSSFSPAAESGSARACRSVPSAPATPPGRSGGCTSFMRLRERSLRKGSAGPDRNVNRAGSRRRRLPRRAAAGVPSPGGTARALPWLEGTPSSVQREPTAERRRRDEMNDDVNAHAADERGRRPQRSPPGRARRGERLPARPAVGRRGRPSWTPRGSSASPRSTRGPWRPCRWRSGIWAAFPRARRGRGEPLRGSGTRRRSASSSKGRRRGCRMYVAAHGLLDGDARDLVALELIPRQRRQRRRAVRDPVAAHGLSARARARGRRERIRARSTRRSGRSSC